MALDIAPGLGREFAFEKFLNFNSQVWIELIQLCKARRKPSVALPIHGSDLDGTVLKAARANLAGAGTRAGRKFEAGECPGNHRASQTRNYCQQPAVWRSPRRAASARGTLSQAGRCLEKTVPRLACLLSHCRLAAAQAHSARHIQTHTVIQWRVGLPAIRVQDDRRRDAEEQGAIGK